MAQHDYNIANQSGAAFRADLNNALLAIVSQNSGTSAPSTTFAHQLWADTTTGILKIRNAANSAWIELMQLDGTLTMEDGTALLPGLAFRDDLNTGLFSDAADTLGIATNGVERVEFGTSEVVFNDGGNDVDFRVEGDTNANALFVDAANDCVGIGTSSVPSGNVNFVVNRASGPGSIQLAFDNGPGGAIVPASTGGLEFYTYTGTVGSETYSERFRITSNGSIAIASTSISTTTQSDGSTVLSPVVEIKGTNASAVNATGAIRLQRQDGNAGAFIYSSGDDGGLVLRTVDANGITFRNSSGSALGHWRNAGGLCFNADTAAANALDDYEEGTFTVTPNTNLTLDSSFTTWSYTKIGRQVTVSGLLKVSSVSGTNAVTGSLPFFSASSPSSGSASCAGGTMHSGVDTGDAGLAWYISGGGSNTFTFYRLYDNGGWDQLPNSALAATDEIYATMTYFTS